MNKYPPCPYCGAEPTTENYPAYSAKSRTKDYGGPNKIFCSSPRCVANYTAIPEKMWIDLCRTKEQLDTINQQYTDSLKAVQKENEIMHELIDKLVKSIPQSWIDSRDNLKDRSKFFLVSMEIIEWLEKQQK